MHETSSSGQSGQAPVETCFQSAEEEDLFAVRCPNRVPPPVLRGDATWLSAAAVHYKDLSPLRGGRVTTTFDSGPVNDGVAIW